MTIIISTFVSEKSVKRRNRMKTIAIFASGEGTNAENLMDYFSVRNDVKVGVVVYNRKEAGVRIRAERYGVPTEYVPKSRFGDKDFVITMLKGYGTDVIVLSGFLLLVPDYLLEAYPNRVVNIHPSLLPKHGGRGMYGLHVHEDVLRCGEDESGITIHVCDSDLDRGVTLFRAKCNVERNDTPETLAARVQKLEYAFFPEVVERLCRGEYDYKFEH